MYCEILTGEMIIESIKKRAFHEEVVDFVEVECPTQARFLVVSVPSELIFLVVNIDRVSFKKSAEHVLYSEIKEMHSHLDGPEADHYKKLYVNEEGFVRSQMGKDGPLLPFSAPFNNFRQDPGSANILIQYLDVCWPEMKSKIREALLPLGMYLLVHEVSRTSSLFLLSLSSEIPRY